MNIKMKFVCLAAAGALSAFSVGAVPSSKALATSDGVDLGVAVDHPMWTGKVRLRPGVELKALDLKEPRMMKAYVATIDLETPGISFTGTERAAEWGLPMPDYTNRTMIIHTKREKTADFMMRRRAEGRNVSVAVNTSPWGPWDGRAAYRSVYGSFARWNVVDGIEITRGKDPRNGAFFVVYKNGKVDITPSVSVSRTNEVSIAMCGFGMIMTNGVSAVAANAAGSLHPRTAIGVDAGRKKLVLLVVDGRQATYSLGASLKDLCDIMRAEGVSDAVNMDGGGSSSLVVFDADDGRPWMLNRHKRFDMRRNAMNLGISFGDK